jgi:phosphate transport system substrate-binding protein
MKPLTYLPLGLLATTLALAPALTIATIAQETKSEFPMPASVKSGTKLRLDGSSSMALLNENLKSSFEQKFAGSQVNLAANGTDKALEALLKGDLDIVATGRALTGEEKAKGLKEQLLSREKIAIVVGKENPFKGDITFQQFAKIFRGEIKDWSELGGAAGPIKLVDRPEFSDTRISLSRYKVFEGAPFQAGAGATALSADDTAAMAKELGKDGIGYAIANQVQNRDDLTIVPMHKTLPSDPRYPYSQPRGYIFKQDASQAVQDFLGYAAAPAGQDVVKQTLEAEAAGTAVTAAAPNDKPNAAGSAPDPAGTNPGTNSGTNPYGTNSADASAAANAEGGGGKFPWWIPLLGLLGAGGLWWLFKGKGNKGGAAVPPEVATGSLVGAGRRPNPPGPTGGGTEIAAKGNGLNPIGLGTAVAGAGAAALGAAALGKFLGRGRISLAERPNHQALAEWEVPEMVKHEARQTGGRQYNLRVSDVTGGKSLDRGDANSYQDYACTETTTDRTISNLTGGREYQAEIGFRTQQNEWMPIARSNRISMPKIQSTPNGNVVGGAAAVAGLGLAAAAAAKAKETPKVDLPNIETPKVELEPPKVDLPNIEPPKVELPTIETPKVETPKVELPKVETPAVETPAVEAPTWDPNLTGLGVAGAVGAAGLAGLARSPEAAPADVSPMPQAGKRYITVVDSNRNCYQLTSAQRDRLQQSSAKLQLEPGKYRIRIKQGSFGYKGGQPREPLAMLRLNGGRFMNQQTGVTVNSTWATLNGYEDAMIVHVYEPTSLHAFYIDTYVGDNEGDVTLSIDPLP